jgi:hypothetical protein
MAIKCSVTPDKGHKYIPLAERGSENPFTVWIKPLGARDLLELEDMVVQKKAGDVMILASGIFAFRIVQRAIVDWENLIDDSNKQIKPIFSIDGVVSDESLSRLPAAIINEISNIVSHISKDPSQIQILLDSDASN